MESNAPSEELPALYRAILDRVATLEAAGDRDEGLRVRRAASKAYSRAWDEQARRQLISLLREAERPTPDERAKERRQRRQPADRRPRRRVAHSDR